MNHQEALQEMAVERYLLGELSGASLLTFEEHLFDCPQCAQDVNAGATFIDAARTELRFPRRAAVIAQPEPPRKWTDWLTNPRFLAPALGACLLLLGIETFVLQPRMRLQLAEANTPAVLNQLVLANANARGDGLYPEILAPEHGSFLLSIDVPSSDSYTAYRCSLYGPNGALEWQTTVSPEQARDALLVRMPTDKVVEGLNKLIIEGQLANATMQELTRYPFTVKIQK
jgi:Putative zinc-finger